MFSITDLVCWQRRALVRKERCDACVTAVCFDELKRCKYDDDTCWQRKHNCKQAEFTEENKTGTECNTATEEMPIKHTAQCEKFISQTHVFDVRGFGSC